MNIYTIGHSDTPLLEFVRNLRAHGVETLADVRTSPYSRHAAHFSHDRLKNALPGFDIAYEFMGDCLGGRPSKPEYLNSKGESDYEKMAADQWFIDGLDRLIEMARGTVVCVMCSEEDPAKCHRGSLLAPRLAEKGATVLHIRRDGSTETEDHNARRRFSAARNQMDLFD